MFGRKRRSREPETVDIEARLSILDLRASARQGTTAPAAEADPAESSVLSASGSSDTQRHETPTPDLAALEPTPLEPVYAEVAVPEVIDLTEQAQPEYAAVPERSDESPAEATYGEGDRHW